MSDYENATAGEHESRLVYVLSLGTHQDEYKGEKKNPCEKKVLGLEVVDQTVEINGEEKPRIVWTKPFNSFSSLTEKGKETEYYWAFDPNIEAGSKPNWEDQLGKPCTVHIQHVKSKDGAKTYDNVSTLTPIPKKYQDKVEANQLTPGISLETESDLHNKLFGLAKYVYDNRLEEEREDGGINSSNLDDDFDSDIPF